MPRDNNFFRIYFSIFMIFVIKIKVVDKFFLRKINNYEKIISFIFFYQKLNLKKNIYHCFNKNFLTSMIFEKIYFLTFLKKYIFYNF